MTAVNTVCQGIHSMYHFGHACHRFVSPVLGGKGGPVRRADNLETFIAACPEILGVSNS